MKIRIKRIDKSLPLPDYNPATASAVDLYAREEIVVDAQSVGKVPTNIIVDVPDGYAFIVVPRSSTPGRKGLSIPHGMGIIDPTYHGPGDEVKMQFYNFTDEPVKIEKGERVGQGFVLHTERIEWDESEEHFGEQRGGFGSTGI